MKERGSLIARNALWLILGRGLQCLLNLLAGTLTVRYLGPENLGLLQYGAAYTAFFSSLCTLGIPSVLVKTLTDNPEEEGTVLGTALGMQGASSLVSTLVILGIVYAADGGDPVTVQITALSCAAMGLRVLDTMHYWFQSRMCSRVTALAGLGAFGVTTLYKLALVVWKRPVLWFAAASGLDYGLLGLFLLWAYKRQGGRPLGFSREWCARLLKSSCHFILPGLLIAVYGQTDRIMLKHMAGQAEVGYYAAAVSLCNGWCFVLNALIDAMYPEIARAHGKSKALFEKRNRQLYGGIFYLSMGVSGMLWLLAEPLTVLLYGESYRPGGAVLQILTWYTAFSYLGGARNAWVVCENRQKYLIWTYLAAAVSNVALNLLLIPRFGAQGAAAASLAAQFASAVIAPWWIPGLRENVNLMVQAVLLKDLGRPGRKAKRRDLA